MCFFFPLWGKLLKWMTNYTFFQSKKLSVWHSTNLISGFTFQTRTTSLMLCKEGWLNIFDFDLLNSPPPLQLCNLNQHHLSTLPWVPKDQQGGTHHLQRWGKFSFKIIVSICVICTFIDNFFVVRRRNTCHAGSSSGGRYLGILIEWIFCWIEYIQIQSFESILEKEKFSGKKMIKLSLELNRVYF